MKRILTVLFAVSIAILTGCGGSEKMASMIRQMYYTIQPSVRNGNVEIEMKMTFPFFYPTAKLEITPVLKYDGKESSFASETIQGERVRENNPVCSSVNGGTFSIRSSIRFEKEMCNSELYVRAKIITGDKEILCPDIKIDKVISPMRLDKSVEYTPKVLELRDSNVVLEMNAHFPWNYLWDATAKVEMTPILKYKGKEKSFESYTIQGREAQGNYQECSYDQFNCKTKSSIRFEEEMRNSKLYVREKIITGDIEIVRPDVKVADFNPPIPKVSFEGIGITFQKANDSVYVTDLYVGSPAEKAGLKQGDCIITVNNETISGVGMTNTDIKGKLDGPKGTKVRLGVVKLESQELTSIEITREPIYEETVTVNYKKQKTIGVTVTPKQYCDFSAVCSSGQTLYYKIRNSNTVCLCMPMWYPDFVGEYKTYGHCAKPMGHLIIPETVTFEGKTYVVTEISKSAFSECEELTSVTIPNSINSIGSYAFDDCKNLRSITIKSEGTFGFLAFRGCNKLNSVTIKNEGEKHISAANIYFKKGKLWYNVIDKNTVVVAPNMDEYKYSGDIVIPRKITAGNTFSVIGVQAYAFAECIDLKTIAIPSTIKTIGEYAFRSCIHLTAIYCQAKSEPNGWTSDWNPNKYKVVWGAIDKFKSNGKNEVTTEKSSTQKVYYVVLGSYNTLEEAQAYNSVCPDWMECWIYKCTSNGKTVYRTCYACFSTRQKAQTAINKWHSDMYDGRFDNAWIWENNGLGNCVFCPDNYETEMTMPPLSPE